MSHSPQKSESILRMFLQRVQSSCLIIECKLGLTSLHDFVVHQVFCTFVLSVKGSHGPPKDVGFLALRKELLSIIPYLVPNKSCVSIVRNEDGEKVGFAFDCVSFCIWWLIRLVIMSRQGHGLYIASVAIAWWMHRCICLLSRTHSLKKLLYWCESLFLGAVVCIRQGVHI